MKKKADARGQTPEAGKPKESRETSRETPETRETLSVELWPIDRPKPYPRNARTTSSRAIDSVAASLKEFGWRQPIVCDAKDVIVAGHKRLLAAEKLGLTHVPVHVASGLTAAQCKAYRLMDNRSNQNSEWDMELLQAEMQELVGKIDTALTGFEQVQIDEFLKASGQTGPDPNIIPEQMPPRHESRRHLEPWWITNHLR